MLLKNIDFICSVSPLYLFILNNWVYHKPNEQKNYEESRQAAFVTPVSIWHQERQFWWLLSISDLTSLIHGDIGTTWSDHSCCYCASLHAEQSIM